MPIHHILQRAPARPAFGLRARSASMACLLLLATLAGAGCSDQTAPTSPDAGGDPLGAADAKRTTFISDLQLRTTNLYPTSDGYVVEVTYELTNSGGKTSGLHIHGELQQGSVNQASDYAPIYCEEVPGTLRHGTCRRLYGLLIPATGLQSGAAQFTLRLSKRVNNVVTTVDSRSVDVWIVR